MAEPHVMIVDAAADDKYIYVVGGYAEGFIARIPIGGGALEMLGSDNEGPEHIALSGDTVYFTTGQSLKSIPKSGGAPKLLMNQVIGSPIAADAHDVYVVRSPFKEDHASLVAVPIAGGPIRVVDDNGARELAIDADAVYLNRFDRDPRPDGAFVTMIERVPKAGGPKTVVAKRKYTTGFALSGESIYFSEAIEGTFRVSKHGGEPQRIDAQSGDKIVVLGDTIYTSSESSSHGGGYASRDDGYVRKFAEGKRMQALFNGEIARALVVAGGSVYFFGKSKGQSTPGSFYRLPPL